MPIEALDKYAHCASAGIQPSLSAYSVKYMYSVCVILLHLLSYPYNMRQSSLSLLWEKYVSVFLLLFPYFSTIFHCFWGNRYLLKINVKENGYVK